jgi:iron(III) transport system ATP-binding protein
VVVRNLSKTYKTRRGDLKALDNVSLEVGAGEFLVLLGPSGCGKTTLLRSVAGLDHADSGEIYVQGQLVFSDSQKVFLPPERRNLSMVFQSYALWPHMTVQDNIAYPLENAGLPKSEVKGRSEAVLKVVGLETYAGAYPGQLSGGQQQRVALARAMVRQEGLVLFDEPLSNLDAKVRERLRVELLALQREIGFTALYVTHDQTEASALADRIAVMDVGRFAQLGSPQEIYNEPRSRHVAAFVGSANEVQGTVVGSTGEEVRISTPLGEMATSRHDGSLAEGQTVTVLFRPEHCEIVPNGTAGAVNQFSCTLKRSMFLGAHVEHVVSSREVPLVVRGASNQLLAEGVELTLRVPTDQTHVFVVA